MSAPSSSTSNSKLVRTLRKKATEWGTKIRLGNASHYEAWVALHTNMSARLKYPLSACTLSESECKRIMSPAIKAALPRSGFSATISTDIREGPRPSGGAGVLSLFHYAGAARTAVLLEHRFQDTPLGKMLTINMEDLIQETGLYGHLWDMNMDHCLKYVSHHSWIFHTCLYNYKHKVNITQSHSHITPRRTNDHSIMSLAIDFYPDKASLRSINKVRMFHNIYHLSDITCADGRTFNHLFNNSTPFPSNRNTHHWPHKHHVTSKDFTCWRRFLTYVFTVDSMRLPAALGNWISTTTVTFPTWDWFGTPSKEFLFHRIDNTWHRHLKKPNSHHSYYPMFLELNSVPSTSIIPASVQVTAHAINVQSYSPPVPSPPLISTFILGPFTFLANIQQ